MINFQIIKEISIQSPDINRAVVKDKLCANDQGIIYGYACSDTKELMPLPIMIAHKIMKKYEEFRKGCKDFFADAKSQVSVEYDDGEPKKIVTIVISVSHSEKLSNEEIYDIIKQEVALPVLKQYQQYCQDEIEYLINPSGKFTIWGSFSDSGCLGR